MEKKLSKRTWTQEPEPEPEPEPDQEPDQEPEPEPYQEPEPEQDLTLSALSLCSLSVEHLSYISL